MLFRQAITKLFTKDSVEIATLKQLLTAISKYDGIPVPHYDFIDTADRTINGKKETARALIQTLITTYNDKQTSIDLKIQEPKQIPTVEKINALIKDNQENEKNTRSRAKPLAI